MPKPPEAQSSRLGRTMVGKMGNASSALGDKCHPPILYTTTITDRDAAEGFSAAVIDISAGRLAVAARRSKDTAKRWKSARAAPSAASLINMARTLPTVRAWLLAEIDSSTAAQFDAGQLFKAIESVASHGGTEGEAARAILRAMGK